jgi:hypothetical protein
MTLSKLVTVLVCLRLLAAEQPANEAAAGYLSFTEERGDTFWEVCGWLGLTKPGQIAWFRPRPNCPPNGVNYVYEHRYELGVMRMRLNRRP